MKRLVEDTFHITAKEAAKALPKSAEAGKILLEIADSYSQEIAVVSTASNLECLVRWFICPACQNRVGKLYLPFGEAVFLCRKCHDLGYRAQQLRAFRKPDEAGQHTRAKKYTREDYIREAMDFLKKMRSKQNAMP